jgi:2Fe-2S ferredoxin
MPKVTFRQPDGQEETCDVAAGSTVMDGAIDHHVPGIRAQCGGACVCATCHCYVDADWLARLAPPERNESEMLDYVWEPRTGSRLSCQIVMTEALDGLVVEVPERQV